MLSCRLFLNQKASKIDRRLVEQGELRRVHQPGNLSRQDPTLAALKGRPVKRVISALLLILLSSAATAEALRDPPICSAIDAAASELHLPFCRVAPLSGKPGQHEVTLSLTATTGPVHVGGYRITETDNYNGGYLPPAAELKPGDTLKVRLLNALAPASPNRSPRARRRPWRERPRNKSSHPRADRLRQKRAARTITERR